jgi:hypothetical protein
MYLKDDKIIITIGQGVVMRTFRIGTGPQFLLDATALVGWTDGVDIKRNFTPRQMRSGDFQEEGHHAARYISITGMAVAPTNTALKLMRDDFTGAVMPSKYQPITVEDSFGVRSSTVTLGGKTSWIQMTDTVANFKLDLYAPDPYVYGPQKQLQVNSISYYGGATFPAAFPFSFNRPPSALSLVIDNAGNVDSWPIFVATGDLPTGFTVTNNAGRTVTYSGTVTYNAPVSIDMQRGIAMQNGVDRSDNITQRQWFSIPPGSAIQPSFGALTPGPGWCDILYKDTWI